MMEVTQIALSLPVSDRPAWGVDWLWGCPLIMVTVIIHVLILGFLSQRAVLICGDIRKSHHPRAAFTAVVGAITLLATLLHGVEAAIWAIAYRFLGALPDAKTAMLYSLGAMTTYGHQSLYLEQKWQLLGTIEALSGWLLFGLSTAFLFWMIQEVSPGHRSSH